MTDHRLPLVVALALAGPLALVLVASTAPLAEAASVTVSVTRAPDVVVTTDFEGEEFTTPRYRFSAQARITNDDTARRVTLHTVTYLDRSVTGCPERPEGVRPVHAFAKNLELDAGESVTVGGLARVQQGQDLAYWPMEVFRKYPDPSGGMAPYEAGQHTFCVTVVVSGNDPACAKTAQEVCTLAADDFRAYARHTNTAPEVTTLEARPTDPRPGQAVVLTAEATDPDDTPKPDTLRYTWDLGTEEKDGRVVQAAWSTPGTRTVVLTVTDGFVTVERTLNVSVQGQPVDPSGGDGDDGANGTPGPVPAVVVTVVAGAAWAARHRRRCARGGPGPSGGGFGTRGFK